MKTLLLFALTLLCVLPDAGADPQLPELYSTEHWEITGQPGKVMWVEIHNAQEARTSGIAHVMILARKKKAPVYEVEYVCDHLAITTEALQRSVLRPFKRGGVYPERFLEAYERWKQDQSNGTAFICSNSIQEFLKTRNP